MTPKQWDNLPQCFKDKINIDNDLADFKQDKVLDFKAGRHLVLTQLTLRYRCKAATKKNGSGMADAS